MVDEIWRNLVTLRVLTHQGMNKMDETFIERKLMDVIQISHKNIILRNIQVFQNVS